MKQVQALIAAFVVTGLVAFGMLAVGVSAAINPNTTPITDSPSGSLSTVSPDTAPLQVDQLQIQLNGAIQRINQANAQLEQLNSQLQQANARLQQDESILNQLQRRGLIQIQSDGTVLLRGGRR